MYCLEHLFSANPQTVCMLPWQWWDRLSETDQATWIGAWGAAGAFLGGLYVYWHGKKVDREREAERLRLSAQHQAIALLAPIARVTEQVRTVLSRLEQEQLQFVRMTEVDQWQFGELNGVRAALTDAHAFGADLGMKLQRFIHGVRRLEQELADAMDFKPGERGTAGQFVLVWDEDGSGDEQGHSASFRRLLELSDELRGHLMMVAAGEPA